MANSYYNATHNPPTGGSLSSQQIREEFLLVEEGFDGIGDGPAVAELWATSMVPFPGSDGMKGARAYAVDSNDFASAANQSANNTENLFIQFRGVYYGALDEDPALDPNGDPCDVGDWYTNTITGGIRLFNGSNWGNPLSGAKLTTFTFTAAGSETEISGLDDDGKSLVYTPDFLQVYVDGMRLTPGTDYEATDGTSITGLAALSPGDTVVIDAFSPFEVGEEVLLPENNLGDVDSVSQARTNLGLGAAAVLGIATVADILAGTGTGLVQSEDITASLEPVTLADAATVVVDGSLFVNGVVVIAGNRTLGNMSNKVIGRTYTLRVASSSATPRDLALGGQYIPSIGLSLEGITNAAGARRMLTLHVVSSTEVIVSGVTY